MESPPLFRIVSKSGVVIADDLPLFAPSIQLIEGTLSKGDKPPKDLSFGESSVVAYPLVSDRLICRVTRVDSGAIEFLHRSPIDFIEPDSLPQKAKRNPIGEALEAEHKKQDVTDKPATLVRRTRSKKAN